MTIPVCSAGACEEPLHAKGFCYRHYREHYANVNRERIRRRDRERYAAEAERRREAARIWLFPGWIRSRRLNLYETQGRRCAVCCEPAEFDALEVDHDHACCDIEPTCGNCVRGLVHHSCNARIRSHEQGGRWPPKWHADVARYLDERKGAA